MQHTTARWKRSHSDAQKAFDVIKRQIKRFFIGGLRAVKVESNKTNQEI